MVNDNSHKDETPLSSLCVAIQRYYERNSIKTQVLPASLISTEEVMGLAGVRHMTIAPALLEQLSRSENVTRSLFDEPAVSPSGPGPSTISFLNDEAAYRIAFTRANLGKAETKLTEVGNGVPTSA